MSIGDEATREEHRKRLGEAYDLCKPDVQAAAREICKLLFPEIETLYEGVALGGGFYEEWRKAKRICSVDFFSRYFYLRPSDQEVSQAEFEAFVKDAGNHAQLVIRLGELVDNGRIDNFLVRLGDAVPGLADEHTESAVLALFDTGDKLQTRLLSENQLLRVASVVHKMLVRLKKPARLSILLKAATEATSLEQWSISPDCIASTPIWK